MLVIGLALEIAGHRLPQNRWRRGVRFLAPGFGIGLVATFTVSATRLLLPSATVWVPLVLGCGAVAFLIGYLTPTPQDWSDGTDGYVGAHRHDGYPADDQAALEGALRPADPGAAARGPRARRAASSPASCPEPPGAPAPGSGAGRRHCRREAAASRRARSGR